MADETQENLQNAEEESESNEIPNIVTVEDAGTLKKKVIVSIPREKIDAKTDEMFGELGNSAQVPGFRVGHAPRRLIEKRFGKEVTHDVRNALVGESIGDAIEKSELKTLGEPDLDLDAIEVPDTGNMEFSFEVEVAPEFDLPELKGVKVEKQAMAVDDKKADEYLEQIRTGRARYEVADKAAAEGDVVTAEVKISGEGIETLDRKGITLRVAPGQVEGIPLVDLGKTLTGTKADKTVSLAITCPKSHPNEDWQEKDLTVELAITQVQKRILPELDDEFATSAGFESVKDMKEFVRSRLEGQLETESKRSMRDQICQYLLDNISFDLPEGVTARHTSRLLQRRYVELLQTGYPREKIDENLTELQAGAAEQAARELKLQFIVGKIAEQEEIEVSEDEINSRIAMMAQSYNRRPERMRQELEADGSLSAVETSIREEKALDKLLNDAKVTETKGEPAKKTEKKAAKKAVKKTEKKVEKKTAKKTEKKAVKKTEKKTTKKAAKKTDKK